jgi:2-iminobutanoate/2-iminopropanoate deaminase
MTVEMGKREIKHPDKQVSTGAYSAGIEIAGFVWISGQGPLNLETGEVVHGSIEDETRLTLRHIEKILGSAGCTVSDIVKCSVHLQNIADFDAFNVAYQEFFRNVHPLPARTTVQSVLWGGIKIEIDAVAYRPGSGQESQ